MSSYAFLKCPPGTHFTEFWAHNPMSSYLLKMSCPEINSQNFHSAHSFVKRIFESEMSPRPVSPWWLQMVWCGLRLWLKRSIWGIMDIALQPSTLSTTMSKGEYWSDLKIKTRQIWGIWKLRPAYSPETPNLGQNRWCFVPCDLEIWWMTLENNRASLLCCFKLCATFHSHRWIQTGVTVQKCPIWVKIIDFFSRATLQFDVWP